MPVMTFVMTTIMAAALVMLITMRAASFSRILQFSVQIVSHNEVHIATAAAHHLYVVALQNIQGTFAHAAGQHHFNAKLPEHIDDSRLASASLGRGQRIFHGNFAVFHRIDGIMVAMAKMIVHLIVSCRYCYFHFSTDF